MRNRLLPLRRRSLLPRMCHPRIFLQLPAEEEVEVFTIG
jgi:uncharacterized Zn-finger protein